VTTKIDYTALAGGLDLVDTALTIKPGRLAECLNFEQIFGKQGYWRIDGYERYDGRAQPSDAEYSTQAFDGGTAAIAAGDIVTGTSVTALVVSVTLSSGSWAGGDAAGTLVLTSVSGAWADNGNIQVSAATKALANGVTVAGSIADASYETRLTASRTALRALIQKVPGEGSILGGAVYRGVVYAVRNAVGSATAVLYKSTASGWSSVQAGLIPSGAWRFITANFSGASTTLALFGVDGKNRLLKYDGSAVSFPAPIYGSEATSTSSVAIGLGAKTFTIAEGSRSWTPGGGDLLTIWDAATAGNSMTGTSTSYNSGTNTLVMDVTSVTGSGTKTAWVIGKTDFSDKPFDLALHKDHMWLAYPLGQLQTSNLGDPMVYTTSAALFGLGDELTGISSLKGEVLGVFCRNRIAVISGTSVTDWDQRIYSYTAGAVYGTVQDRSGNALFLDDRGLTTLQATLAFGDFEDANFSLKVKPYLTDSRIALTVGGRVARSKNQYRLYFSDGDVLSFALLSPDPVIRPSDVAPMAQVYPHTVTSLFYGDMSDGEGLFFGTSDGYVMREDKGTSFDGADIQAVLRLPFNHFKSPASKKRFRKLVLEMYATDDVTINFKQIFDYADGNYRSSVNQSADVYSNGFQISVSEIATARLGVPIVTQAEANVDGVGRNQSLLMWNTSAFVRPFVLQGLLTHYTILGMTR
jgi:hypothetical protein